MKHCLESTYNPFNFSGNNEILLAGFHFQKTSKKHNAVTAPISIYLIFLIISMHQQRLKSVIKGRIIDVSERSPTNKKFKSFTIEMQHFN